jgi:hypothetical protein
VGAHDYAATLLAVVLGMIYGFLRLEARAGTPFLRPGAPGCSRLPLYSIFREEPVLLSSRYSGCKRDAPDYRCTRSDEPENLREKGELLLKRYAKLGLATVLLAVALILASCGRTGGSSQNQSNDGMDHDHRGHGPGGMASGLVMEKGRYSDERFIDAMVPHNQGAVEMACGALENAEHEEVKQLSGGGTN